MCDDWHEGMTGNRLPGNRLPCYIKPWGFSSPRKAVRLIMNALVPFGRYHSGTIGMCLSWLKTPSVRQQPLITHSKHSIDGFLIVRRGPVLHIFPSRPAYRRIRSALVSLEHAFLQLPRPSSYGVLRIQLIILRRQVDKPRFTPTDRIWLVLLASRVRRWKEAILTFKPDTLLRWRRQGFRLFWRFKSRNRGGPPRVTLETVALIQQMARANGLWGVERIRGELMNLGLRVPRATIQKYPGLAVQGRHPPSTRLPRQWSELVNFPQESRPAGVDM